jgi:hypothetical protein
VSWLQVHDGHVCKSGGTMCSEAAVLRGGGTVVVLPVMSDLHTLAARMTYQE